MWTKPCCAGLLNWKRIAMIICECKLLRKHFVCSAIVRPLFGVPRMTNFKPVGTSILKLFLEVMPFVPTLHWIANDFYLYLLRFFRKASRTKVYNKMCLSHECELQNFRSCCDRQLSWKNMRAFVKCFFSKKTSKFCVFLPSTRVSSFKTAFGNSGTLAFLCLTNY